MGTCWNCNTELSLEKDQTNCDSCGEIIFYRCNSCKEGFTVEDKKSKKKLQECKLCGFFKCPHCDICYWDCKKFKWEIEILKILRPEVTQGNCPNVLTKVKEIVNYFESEKISVDRKSCPERNVPITYAKTKIKNLLAKFEGFRVKDEEDREAFLKRMDEITDRFVGSELTVSSEREKGSYGQEYRDAFNLSVCLGRFEIVRKKKQDSEEEYDVFVRCEKEPCKFLAQEDLVINECKNCKKRFLKGIKYCDVCQPYKKGKEVGKLRKLKERLNNNDTCQMYRGYFKK